MSFDHHDEGEADEARVYDVMTQPMLLLGISDLIDLFVEEAFDYSWKAWVCSIIVFNIRKWFAEIDVDSILMNILIFILC